MNIRAAKRCLVVLVLLGVLSCVVISGAASQWATALETALNQNQQGVIKEEEERYIGSFSRRKGNAIYVLVITAIIIRSSDGKSAKGVSVFVSVEDELLNKQEAQRGFIDFDELQPLSAAVHSLIHRTIQPTSEASKSFSYITKGNVEVSSTVHTNYTHYIAIAVSDPKTGKRVTFGSEKLGHLLTFAIYIDGAHEYLATH